MFDFVSSPALVSITVPDSVTTFSSSLDCLLLDSVSAKMGVYFIFRKIIEKIIIVILIIKSIANLPIAFVVFSPMAFLADGC